MSVTISEEEFNQLQQSRDIGAQAAMQTESGRNTSLTVAGAQLDLFKIFSNTRDEDDEQINPALIDEVTNLSQHSPDDILKIAKLVDTWHKDVSLAVGMIIEKASETFSGKVEVADSEAVFDIVRKTEVVFERSKKFNKSIRKLKIQEAEIAINQTKNAICETLVAMKNYNPNILTEDIYKYYNQNFCPDVYDDKNSIEKATSYVNKLLKKFGMNFERLKSYYYIERVWSKVGKIAAFATKYFLHIWIAYTIAKGYGSGERVVVYGDFRDTVFNALFSLGVGICSVAQDPAMFSYLIDVFTFAILQIPQVALLIGKSTGRIYRIAKYGFMHNLVYTSFFKCIRTLLKTTVQVVCTTGGEYLKSMTGSVVRGTVFADLSVLLTELIKNSVKGAVSNATTAGRYFKDKAADFGVFMTNLFTNGSEMFADQLYGERTINGGIITNEELQEVASYEQELQGTLKTYWEINNEVCHPPLLKRLGFILINSMADFKNWCVDSFGEIVNIGMNIYYFSQFVKVVIFDTEGTRAMIDPASLNANRMSIDNLGFILDTNDIIDSDRVELEFRKRKNENRNSPTRSTTSPPLTRSRTTEIISPPLTRSRTRRRRT